MRDLWTELTRKVGSAISVRDQAVHAVDARERDLQRAEAEFIAADGALTQALAALHAEFPEVKR